MENVPSNEIDADKLLHSVCTSKRITPEGEQWLAMALDPFPDETRVCGGFPDMISSKSLRYPVKQELTIGDGGLGAAWDALIGFQGFYNTMKLRTTTRNGNTFQNTGQGATDYDIGGFQVRRALTGAALVPSTIVANVLPPVPAFSYRIISLGMEVQNVTEPLYRSGSSTSFRQPTVPLEPGVANVSTLNTAAATAVAYTTVRELPTTAAMALNIPDSKEFTAEQGSYMVLTMDGPTNPVNAVPSAANAMVVAFLGSGGVDYFPSIVGAALPFNLAGTSNSKIPYNSCGVYFTGLSAQTKLRVVLHAVVEMFPEPTDVTLTALSRPSAAYDPEALVLYARALRQLPVAVPVADNWIGAWFLEAAKSIANWAAPKLLKGFEKSDEEKKVKTLEHEVELLKQLRQYERPIPKQPQPTIQGGQIRPRKPLPPIPQKKKKGPPAPPKI